MSQTGRRYVVVDGQVWDPVQRWSPQTGTRTEWVNTKIECRRYTEFVDGKQYPLTGYETDRAGVQRAAEILAAQFPKARIGFMNAPRVADEEHARVLTGWGYSGTMLVVNETVVISPLQILMRDYAGRTRNGEQTMESFAQEIKQVAPGVLADIE